MMTMHYFLYSAIILLSNIKRKDFGEICRNLTEIDKNFEYFDTRFDYKKIGGVVRKNVIKLMTWITALVILGAVLAYKFDEIKRHEEHIFFFWCLSIASIIMMSFKFSAIGIYRRFFRINEMLRWVLGIKNSTSWKVLGNRVKLDRAHFLEFYDFSIFINIIIFKILTSKKVIRSFD